MSWENNKVYNIALSSVSIDDIPACLRLPDRQVPAGAKKRKPEAYLGIRIIQTMHHNQWRDKVKIAIFLNMKDDALFCVGQKAFIEKDGKVLVLNDPLDGLDFAGGKIQDGEAKNGDASSLIRSLQREVAEETGLDIEVFNPFAVWYHEFSKNSRNHGKVVYLVAFKCKYVSGELKLSDEHDNFTWVDKNSYKELDDGNDYFDVLRKYFE